MAKEGQDVEEESSDCGPETDLSLVIAPPLPDHPAEDKSNVVTYVAVRLYLPRHKPFLAVSCTRVSVRDSLAQILAFEKHNCWNMGDS